MIETMNNPAFENWQPKRELAVPVYLQIESWIENLIFDQVIEPNAPLPAVADLAGRFKVSALTVHKAYRRLKQRGLVYTVVGSGTFVAPVAHNRFVGILIHRETLDLAVETPTVLLYLNTLHRELATNGYIDRIIVDNSHRNIGSRAPISSDAMRVLEDPSLHAVIAMSHEGSDELFDLLKRRHLPSIGVSAEYRDYDTVFEWRTDEVVTQALQRLRQQGVLDVAVIYYDDPEKLDQHRVGYLQRMDALFAAESISMRPDWVIGVSDLTNSGGYHAFEHLWSASQRPRGLILTDDVIAHSALTAVMARHVRVPNDLRICVLGNAGSPLNFPRSWMRWEYDTTAACRQIVDTLARLESGESAPKTIAVIPQAVSQNKSRARMAFEPLRSASFRTAGQILSLAGA